MTDSEGFISKLPSETLTTIFRYLLDPIPKYQFEGQSWKNRKINGGLPVPTHPRERWLARKSYYDDYDGRHHLVPISQTCRRWNSVANEILYKEIYVCTSPSVIDLFTFEADAHGPSIAKNLASTLSTSPHLSSLVRRLVLSTYIHNRETTFHEIEILRMCPFVEDVKINGYNGYLLNQYRPVVASRSNLRTLNISRYSLSDLENDSFMDDEELLVMLRGFPRLEKVDISLRHGRPNARASLITYCKARGIYLHCDDT